MNAGEAYWRERETLARDAERIRMLGRIVGRPGDLWPFQWAQLMAFTLELKPDLVVELGRGYGNSTCAFTESSALLAPNGPRVVSICRSGSWDALTSPRLSKAVAPGWLAPLTIMRGDINAWDPVPEVRDAERILVFWDAHGYDVAEWLFGRLGPLLASREHAVLVHDISDTRYQDASRDQYAGLGLWKGYENDGRRLRIGRIDTAFEEAIALLDFVTRNRIDLRSAEEEIRTYFDARPEEHMRMRQELGDLFSLEAGWFWFEMRAGDGRSMTYPQHSFSRPRTPLERIKGAAKLLLKGYL